MQKIEKWAGYFLPAFLILTSLILFLRNYTSGSFLLGWDSLHPEFNFSLAFERIFWGVLRGEQGLGALTAHSHMADLPRILILFFSSLVLPTSFLRYFYLLICLIFGPLGIYFLLNYLFQREENGIKVKLSSFLGANFYLLNLVTLQHFFVPFEMFTTCFAFLPWVFYSCLKFLREGKKRNLLFLILTLILIMPMAYAATLFYASLAGLILFLIFFILLSPGKRIKLKRFLGILILILGLNAFWILPNIYSLVKQGNIISSSRINTLFSPEAFLRNEDYGNFQNLFLGKNFLFSWRAFNFEQKTFIDLLGEWNRYLVNPLVVGINYSFFVIAILGLILSLIKKEKMGISFLPVLVLSLFFLLSTNPPLGAIYSYLYEKVGLFREGFRMPFTKFSLLFELVLSFYFAYFFLKLFNLFEKKILKVIPLFLSILVFGSLVFYLLPAFQGQFISPLVKRELPNEYFELFSWFKGKQGRIAKLPMQTLWGWEYHNWAYEGSGFLTYGLENSLMDRDFDRWSKENETFYNQASFAIYNQDLVSFEKVLEKYQVRYLLLDESILNAGGSGETLFLREIKGMLEKSSHVKEVANFNFLSVYETVWGKEELSALNSLTQVNANLDYDQIDPIYSKYNNYIQSEEGIKYPFVDFDLRGDVKISLDEKEVTFINEKLNSKVILPLKEKIAEDFTKDRGFTSGYNCDLKKVGEVQKENQGNQIIYEAVDGGVSCDFFDYSTLKHNQGYLLHLKGENLEGRSLKIYLQNYSTNKMDLEELLPSGKFDQVFVILPKIDKEVGYTLNLETRSFGRIASKNIIEKIEFFPVDIDWFTTLYSDIESPINLEGNLEITSFQKRGNCLYLVEIQGQSVLELGQAYEEGWIALDISNGYFKAQKLNHVRINSWANGWEVGNTSKIIIFFWPQLLEWGGILIAILTLLLVLKPQKRS